MALFSLVMMIITFPNNQDLVLILNILTPTTILEQFTYHCTQNSIFPQRVDIFVPLQPLQTQDFIVVYGALNNYDTVESCKFSLNYGS